MDDLEGVDREGCESEIGDRGEMDTVDQEPVDPEFAKLNPVLLVAGKTEEEYLRDRIVGLEGALAAAARDHREEVAFLMRNFRRVRREKLKLRRKIIKLREQGIDCEDEKADMRARLDRLEG